MESEDKQFKSDLILDELKKRQRTRGVVKVEEDQVKVVIVVCGSHLYAFYGSDIREILSTCPVSWVPGLPDYLPGLINVRGDIESVIDLHHILGENGQADHHGVILMAVRFDFRSGIMVDVVEDVVDIPVSKIHPPLGTLNGRVRDLVIGAIDHKGATVSLLDVGKLATIVTIADK